MMPEIIDMVGRRYGMLTVIKRAPDRYDPSGRKRVYWLCQCDCGNTKEVDGSCLRHGSPRSCGCINKLPQKKMEYASGPKPLKLCIQDKYEVGDTLRIGGRKRVLIGKYENFGRWKDEYGLIESFLWWDIERQVRG